MFVLAALFIVSCGVGGIVAILELISCLPVVAGRGWWFAVRWIPVSLPVFFLFALFWFLRKDSTQEALCCRPHQHILGRLNLRGVWLEKDIHNFTLSCVCVCVCVCVLRCRSSKRQRLISFCCVCLYFQEGRGGTGQRETFRNTTNVCQSQHSRSMFYLFSPFVANQNHGLSQASPTALTCLDSRATKQPLLNWDGSSLKNWESTASPEDKSSGNMGPLTLRVQKRETWSLIKVIRR